MFVSASTACAQRLNEQWTIQVNGQVIQPTETGGFRLRNIAAPDQFGAGGPGSAPDFLSDEFLRVLGSAEIDGVNYYAFSDPFQIQQGQTFIVDDLTITTTPPPIPEMIMSLPAPGEPQTRVLDVGQTLQLETLGLLGDGSVRDLTNRTEWTVYRTSNTSVATVGENGLVTAEGRGQAFITAVNEGAAAVLRVTVVENDPRTTVEGLVTFEDGSPAEGAQVVVTGQGLSAVTDPAGFFSIPGVATVLGPVSVRASLGELQDLLGPVEPEPAMITDAGIARLTLPTSSGRQFIAVFQRNFDNQGVTPALFLSADEFTTGEVEIPGLSFADEFVIQPGLVTRVDLPPAVLLDGTDNILDRGVSIMADSDFTVYGLNQKQFTTDAYAALPVEAFGTRHRAMCFTDLGFANNRSQFSVVASEDDTLVTIVPSSTTSGRPAGQPYTITLDRLEVYTLRGDSSGDDLTGSVLVSSKPVGLFSGQSCANVPIGTGFCDHLCQQIPRSNAWGQTAITVPLATRRFGDLIRVLASEDNTTVMAVFEDGTSQEFVLNAGQFADDIQTGVTQFVADRPILVAQYSLGSQFDGVPSDPFMMLVPPAEQFLDRYTFATPDNFDVHFVNVVAEASDAFSGAVVLDGAPVSAGVFAAVEGTTLAYATLQISEGSHTMVAPNRFGISVYGFAADDSYGYPGGIALGDPPMARTLAVMTPLLDYASTMPEVDRMRIRGARTPWPTRFIGADRPQVAPGRGRLDARPIGR